MAPKTRRYNARAALTAATRRVNELETAIRYVVTQKYDDLCWMDIYRNLGTLIGVPFAPQMLSVPTMVRNCVVYCKALAQGKDADYKAPDLRWLQQPTGTGHWWRREEDNGGRRIDSMFKIYYGATGLWIQAGTGRLLTKNMRGVWQEAIGPID